jgi:hypothetical protein
LIVDERLVVEVKAARGIGLHDVKQVLMSSIFPLRPYVRASSAW